jgi:hypothetical protein
MKQEDFDRWFNSSFWRAFKDQAFPLTIPQSVAGRKQLLDKVYSLSLVCPLCPKPS